jgi:hypothetical protein
MLVISNHWHHSFIQGKVFVMTHDCACFYFLIDLTVRLFHFFLMYYLFTSCGGDEGEELKENKNRKNDMNV